MKHFLSITDTSNSLIPVSALTAKGN